MGSFKSVSSPGRKAKAEPPPVKWDLAAEAAHETKNPLQAAKAIVQLINLRYGEDKALMGYMQMMVEQLDSVDETLTTYMDLHTFEYYPSLCSMTELCRSVVALMQGISILRGITTQEDYAEIPPLIMERKCLRQILMNLLKNAFDACSRGGTVRISTALEGGLVLLRVEDDGIGMDEKTQENIFKPFYTSKQEGSGLGLPICLRMAETLRGSLSVRSTLGKGTVFTLAFPATRESR